MILQLDRRVAGPEGVARVVARVAPEVEDPSEPNQLPLFASFLSVMRPA